MATEEAFDFSLTALIPEDVPTRRLLYRLLRQQTAYGQMCKLGEEVNITLRDVSGMLERLFHFTSSHTLMRVRASDEHGYRAYEVRNRHNTEARLRIYGDVVLVFVP